MNSAISKAFRRMEQIRGAIGLAMALDEEGRAIYAVRLTRVDIERELLSITPDLVAWFEDPLEIESELARARLQKRHGVAFRVDVGDLLALPSVFGVLSDAFAGALGKGGAE